MPPRPCPANYASDIHQAIQLQKCTLDAFYALLKFMRTSLIDLWQIKNVEYRFAHRGNSSNEGDEGIFPITWDDSDCLRISTTDELLDEYALLGKRLCTNVDCADVS